MFGLPKCSQYSHIGSNGKTPAHLANEAPTYFYEQHVNIFYFATEVSWQGEPLLFGSPVT